MAALSSGVCYTIPTNPHLQLSFSVGTSVVIYNENIFSICTRVVGKGGQGQDCKVHCQNNILVLSATWHDGRGHSGGEFCCCVDLEQSAWSPVFGSLEVGGGQGSASSKAMRNYSNFAQSETF